MLSLKVENVDSAVCMLCVNHRRRKDWIRRQGTGRRVGLGDRILAVLGVFYGVNQQGVELFFISYTHEILMKYVGLGWIRSPMNVKIVIYSLVRNKEVRNGLILLHLRSLPLHA